MNIKQKPSSVPVLFVYFILILLSLTIISKNFDIIKADITQKLMSLNLGFSSFPQLMDVGSEERYTANEKLTELFFSIPRIIKYKISDHPSHELDKIEININFSDYLQIENDRQIAIKNGILSNPTKVNAIIKYKRNEYKAKIRLKGDGTTHWTSKTRHSIRVRLKEGKTIFGFINFSIQKPRERRHPYDQTFQSMMRDVGNLSPGYKFAHVYVNGSDWGIMACNPPKN